MRLLYVVAVVHFCAAQSPQNKPGQIYIQAIPSIYSSGIFDGPRPGAAGPSVPAQRLPLNGFGAEICTCIYNNCLFTVTSQAQLSLMHEEAVAPG
ncbi:hypothetical protein EVAR_40061_1 [Eumeta japonica]|uniref:Secreted protein n=1 Tax=Eumeta variegata TaxID=151549 RepID=A0A4C1WBZ8_EUMVA|nr:hypothetical protein EVAR_40061_1 [Eumeta japonica]